MEIDISDEIVQRLQKRVDATDEFSSVAEYVEYVLKQVIERLDDEEQDAPEYSKEDEEKVKERLKSLGYLE